MGQIALRADDGRVTGNRGLTDQQQLILETFSQDGTLTGTAKKSGCPYKVVSATLRLAHVQAALLGECRVVMARAAPVAIALLVYLIENKEATHRIRLEASKTLLDRVGLAPVRAGEAGQGDKRDLADLSPAELRAFIDQGQAAITKREAVTVACTPVSDQDAS